MELEKNGTSNSLPLGVLLLALGTVALLAQAGVFRGIGEFLGALIFAGAGIYLVRRHYQTNRELWALCTGFALFGLAAASLLGPLSGTAFLGLTGVGFLLAYNEDRTRSWALIPAGVLFTLALVAGADVLAPPLSGGTIFFAGLAVLFWYLYRNPRTPRRWAFYPAVVFGVLALLTLIGGDGWLFPLLLIAGGFYLLYKRSGSDPREAAAAVGERAEGFIDEAERGIRNFVDGLRRPDRQGGVREAEEPGPRAEWADDTQGEPKTEAGSERGDGVAGTSNPDDERLG